MTSFFALPALPSGLFSTAEVLMTSVRRENERVGNQSSFFLDNSCSCLITLLAKNPLHSREATE